MAVTECPCKRKTCKYFGSCEECRVHHNTGKGKGVPYCERNNVGRNCGKKSKKKDI